jgi:ATP-dependent DNA helicase DinG
LAVGQLSSNALDLIAQAKLRLNPYQHLPLPDWVSIYRPHQIEAIQQIVEGFESSDLVVLDAPTGSGKSLIAETVRQVMELRGVYICSTKTLQDQFIRDFQYGSVLKGRNNYIPELQLEPDKGISPYATSVTCSDCTKEPGNPYSCQWCSSTNVCPYERAKREALQNSLAILNTSYFLTECNGPGRFSETNGRRSGLVIADECDLLEGELMSHVEVSISERRMKQYGIIAPKITVEDSWKEWVDQYLPLLEKRKNNFTVVPDKVSSIREGKYLSSLVQKLRLLKLGLEDQEQKWVYTGTKDRVSFKPITVDTLGEKYLWRHGGKWLAMSATVISAEEFVGSLGWKKEYKVVRVRNTFRKENRKVVYVGSADMSRKGKERGEWQGAAKACRDILARHPRESVLVHTVSYDLGGYLSECCTGTERQYLTYTNSSERERAIGEFTQSEGRVLFASSLDRGIDLPHDRCRVQIIAKVPFPYLGDKQVSARLYGSRSGKVWYNIQTIRTIIQMCGRAVTVRR